jgi:ketosteroid isomerase-like protein
MSSANLDFVRSMFAPWERGDFSSADWADPEIEFVVADGPQPSRSHGVGEMARAWAEFLGAADHLRVHADEYRELDDSRVLVLVHTSGHGKASGMELDQMRAGANVYRLQNGKVTSFVIYVNREYALTDLGLAREGREADPD